VETSDTVKGVYLIGLRRKPATDGRSGKMAMDGGGSSRERLVRYMPSSFDLFKPTN
jgi:hypothetical protein